MERPLSEILTELQRCIEAGRIPSDEGEVYCRTLITGFIDIELSRRAFSSIHGETPQNISTINFTIIRDTGNMTNSNRSINVTGDVSGASLTTGDNNLVATTITKMTLPRPEQVDIGAEIAEFRAIIEGLCLPERGKTTRALDDASHDSAKPDADKKEVANAVERAIKAASSAFDFVTKLDEIGPKIARIAIWLGADGTELLHLWHSITSAGLG